MQRNVFGAAGAALTLCLIGTAAAAQPAAYDWTGYYVGAHIGHDWSDARIDEFNEQLNQVTNVLVPGRGIVIVPGTTRPFPESSFEDSGIVGGVQAGYLLSSGNFVTGVEADFDWVSRSGTVSVDTGTPQTILSSVGTFAIERSFDMDWMWSARARAGFAFDRFLLYATGGMAGARIGLTGTDTIALAGGPAAPAPTNPATQVFHQPVTSVTAASGTQHALGWTLGGGGEWALSDMISIGVEYRHTDLGHINYALTSHDVSVNTPVFTAPAGTACNGCLPARGEVGPTTLHYTTEAISLRVNLRFN